MNLNTLKIAMALVAMAAASLAADRSLVLVQGKATANAARTWDWTLFEEGRPGRGTTGEFFRVPTDRYFLITEAAFTVRGPAAKAPRFAAFRVLYRKGTETYDLATVTDRLTQGLALSTASKRFSPGIIVPSGGDVRGELREIQPAGGREVLDVIFYGYLVPNGQAQ